MALPTLWPKSQNVAWEYQLRGVKEGLTATEALRQYRAGGGAIRDQWWYGGYREAKIVDAIGEQLGDLPIDYEVGAGFARDSPFDWRQEWIMQIEVFGQDPETFEQYSRWVTVESDRRLTMREYMDLAQDAISYTPGSIPFSIQGATDYAFYHRVGHSG